MISNHRPMYAFGPRFAREDIPVKTCRHLRPVQFQEVFGRKVWMHVDNITRCSMPPQEDVGIEEPVS